MTMKLTVRGIFRDKNTPSVRSKVDESRVLSVVHQFSRQFAGLKTINVEGAEGMDIYNAGGKFLFGIDRKDLEKAATEK